MIQRQMLARLFILALLLVTVVGLTGCQPPPVEPEKELAAPSLERASWQDLRPMLANDKDLPSWIKALEASADYYERIKPEATFVFPDGPVAAPLMARACRDLAALARRHTGDALLQAIANRFLLYRSVGKNGSILVTGYYEPLLSGAEKPDQRFRHPIYRRPHDLVEADLNQWFADMTGKRIAGRLEGGKLLPYHSRKEIDEGGKLLKKGLELLWVDNPLDAFFLHVQGSGRVKMADGRTVRLGYDAANGHAYKSIGSILIQEGHLTQEEMSLQTLRKWLTDHPREQSRILNANPSYVFFKIHEGGPFGNINVPLTAYRSIATDHRLFPKGAPAVVVTERPRFQGRELASWEKHAFWAVNQDTGGAIRGPGRVDIFMGFGEESERTAGLMKQPGSLYFIAPKPAKP